MHTAILHPPVNKSGIPYRDGYSVEFDGDLIVEGSRDPEHDLRCWVIPKHLCEFS